MFDFFIYQSLSRQKHITPDSKTRTPKYYRNFFFLLNALLSGKLLTLIISNNPISMKHIPKYYFLKYMITAENIMLIDISTNTALPTPEPKKQTNKPTKLEMHI